MIYLVSGFFRSATTKMMECLEAGGIPVYYSRERNALNEEYTDKRSRPNPRGLYEPSTTDLHEVGFPKKHDGKAIKVMQNWTYCLAVHDYRVVLMKRDPVEIIEDYERTFKDYWDAELRSRWIREYPEKFRELERQFKNRRDVRSVNVIEVDDFIAEPQAALASLDWPIDVERAADLVWQPA